MQWAVLSLDLAFILSFARFNMINNFYKTKDEIKEFLDNYEIEGLRTLYYILCDETSRMIVVDKWAFKCAKLMGHFFIKELDIAMGDYTHIGTDILEVMLKELLKAEEIKLMIASTITEAYCESIEDRKRNALEAVPWGGYWD